WKQFEYTFKPAADDNVALKFLLGKTPQAPGGAHEVSFRNVVLEVKDAPLKRPQTLTADTTDLRVGQPIELAYTDNEAWRTAVTAVHIDGQLLATQKYSVQPGVIVLGPAAFASAGSHLITVKAAGYADVVVTQSLIESDGNLLANGSFSKGTESWEHWVGTKGDSTFEVKDGVADLNIHYNGGITLEWGPPGVPVSWYTQLTQSGIKLEGGKTYELSFRGWSTVDRPIQLELTGYNGDAKINFDINSDSAAVHTAVLKPAAGVTLSLKYLLGNVITSTSATPDDEHHVYLDDILLKEVHSGPQLSADHTDNKLGSNIELTFAGQADWQSAIHAVKINGVTVPMDKVTIGAGLITLDGSLFPAINSYTISVLADGYGANEVVQEITTASPNAAIGKTATAYTNQSSAANAFDGKGTGMTRWESVAASDPQWIAVDLGALYTVDTVVLNWEAAYGKAYKIQVATVAVPAESDWTDVYSEAAGNGGLDTIVLNNIAARHVRMLGSERATPYGYSLWEFEVHGVRADGQGDGGGSGPEEPAQLTPPAVTPDTSGNRVGSSFELTFVSDIAWSSAISVITVGNKELVPGSDYTVADGVITLNSSIFNEAGSYPVLIQAEGYTDAQTTQAVLAADVEVNLALHRTVTASSSNTNFNPNVITDGNLETRWEADWEQRNEAEWVYVDLESVQDIQRLVIKWERAFARHVLVQTADTLTNDPGDWTTIETLDRDPGDASWTETVDLSAQAIQERYIRLYMTERDFEIYGPSIFEFSIY
ncbi:hypothetical protein KC345_g9423, partial [Hortaea werneckii]